MIGLDPGGTTGVALFKFTEDSVTYLDSAQWGDPDNVWKQVKAVAEKLRAQGENVILVIEQFDKRPGIVNPDFTPKYINRDIDNNIFDFPIVYQIPAVAKNLVPQATRGRSDALRRFGWYLVSNRHANDAARHVITFAVTQLKHMPTILKGWPKID